MLAISVGCPDRPAPRYELSPQSGYVIAGPRTRVRDLLIANQWERSTGAKDGMMVDTMYGFLNKSFGTWIFAQLTLKDAPTCGTIVTPLSFQTVRDKPDVTVIGKQMVEDVIRPLQASFAAC